VSVLSFACCPLFAPPSLVSAPGVTPVPEYGGDTKRNPWSSLFFYFFIFSLVVFAPCPDVEAAVATNKSKEDTVATSTDTYNVKDGCYRLEVSVAHCCVSMCYSAALLLVRGFFALTTSSFPG